jgi:ribosomal protein S18 acetylase RimI-like enzyme
MAIAKVRARLLRITNRGQQIAPCAIACPQTRVVPLGSGAVLVRRVGADEVDLCKELGEFVREAYVMLPGHIPEPDYEAELADVAARAGLPHTEVLAAFDDGGRPLGCVTYVAGDGSPMLEHTEPDTASFRMLGVDPRAQRSGAGRALVEACIDRALADGRASIVMHTTTWMHGAHRLYEGLGFVRDERSDWTPVPDIHLLGYRLDLKDR